MIINIKQSEISINSWHITFFIETAKNVAENMKNIISDETEKLTLLNRDLSKRVDEMKEYLTEGNFFNWTIFTTY